MKKHTPRKPKVKKKRPKVTGRQDHRKGPGSGSITASAVWGGIKRAQPNHQERTFSESMSRVSGLPNPLMYPEYEAHDCLTV